MDKDFHLQSLQTSQQLIKAVKNIHSTLAKCDLFAAQQFLRYKGEPQYKTATGGFCSLLVIAIFIVLLVNSGLNVINKATVTASFNIQHQADPASTTLTASPEGKFMFAINVVDTGIQDATYTYFIVSLQQNRQRQLGVIKNVVDIPLEPYTVVHFNFSPEIGSQYYVYDVGANGWLCPPLGQQLKVGGSLVSKIYEYFSLYIKKCDQTVYTNCAPDSAILQKLNAAGVFSAVVAIIATQINPSYTKDYLQHYIEARNIFPFTNTLGVNARSQITDFSIETDISLMPFENKVTETGAYIPDLFEHSTIPVFQDVFAILKFDKSPSQISYTRSFQKIDDFLSYVGGLVGLVFSLIFIMNSYSELCFEISIGSRLFMIDSNPPFTQAHQEARKSAHLYHKYKKKVKDYGLWHRSGGEQSQNEEIVIFSDQSLISSIDSPKYRELKGRFQRYISEGQQSKCLNKDFRERLRKNEELRQKMKSGKQKDSQKVLLGDSYSRELQSSRLRAIHSGGWSFGKYDENAQP